MRLGLGKLIASTALCLLLGGCAQTGPPLPPSLELPKPPTDLRAARKGNRVTLSWSEPTFTTDRQSVRYLGPTLICRSADAEITACPNPVGTVPAPAPTPPKAKPRRTAGQKSTKEPPTPQIYSNTLPQNMQKEDTSAEVTYAVVVLNRNARGAGLSNRVQVPAIMTLPPPNDLSARLTGDGVVLSWTSAAEPPSLTPNMASNSASLSLLYRVYRRDETSGKDAIAGEVPLDGLGPIRFVDSGFEWEKTYLYRITGVSIIKRPESEVQVEGDDTASVRVVAHDIFPPEIPTGLQAAYSGEGQKPFIDLVWAPDTNADLAGYNVFRSEGNAVAVKINTELVKSPSYRDTAVVSGKIYIYSVSAVDVRGNESQRSEPANETVP
jgi:hypothetical protein